MPAIAVAATFTAEWIEETLRFWMRELGLDLQIRFAPYNQVFQQLLDPAGLLASNRDGVNLILVRLEDWSRTGDPPALESNVEHFLASLRAAAGSFPAPLIVGLCPDSPAFLASPGNAAVAERSSARIREAVAPLASVHLITPGELSRLYPVPDFYDPHGNELGHVPYRPVFFSALGTLVARKIRALRTPPYKVIVLDCDETLWSGICGEDGPDGVRIGPERRALQEFMLEQRRAGMLLCLCSKNNEEDVLETFRLNPGMPLRLEHFAARRINWDPKSANLVSLADELGLGLDSFILVDDNPKECAEVGSNCPEALALLLPGNEREIPRFLDHVWAFDHLETTAEDAHRTALYGQQAERRRFEQQAASLGEFLAALNLEVRIEPFAPARLARVAQLTQRTNQMNFTVIRRTESQVQSLLRSGEAEILTVEVTDRFGSYGLVGVMMFGSGDGALSLDTFLLSCRALGRGVEHRMLAHLGRLATERGLQYVEALFHPTARNRPALEFLRSIGAQFEAEAGSELLFRFPAAYLAGIEYKPGEARPPAAPARPARAPLSEERKPVDYARIARELNDPEQIARRVAAERRPAARPNGDGAAPRTDLERRLAEIWARLLHLPAVGIHDDFFDLGGHSLLAVQLLSEVRRQFHVDLSLQIVYGGAFTVAELAKAVELFEIEQAGSGEYAGLLAEIEGLTDEQASELLARERDEGL